jgi:hypothetical protein
MAKIDLFERFGLLALMEEAVFREDWRMDAIAGVLRFIGDSTLDRVFARQLLDAFNVTRCDPPLTHAEIVAVARECAEKRKNERREERRRRREDRERWGLFARTA